MKRLIHFSSLNRILEDHDHLASYQLQDLEVQPWAIKAGHNQNQHQLSVITMVQTLYHDPQSDKMHQVSNQQISIHSLLSFYLKIKLIQIGMKTLN